MMSLGRNSTLHLLFYAAAWKAEGFLTPDQASVFRMAIFHEHKHETHRCRIRIQEPETWAYL